MNRNIKISILVLVFIATALNFLDRQILSITIIKIQKELNLTNSQYGIVNTSFLLSYAVMFTIGGRLTDLFGAKIGLGFSVLIWSIACLLHGQIDSFYQLAIFRFILGVGEGGCFPAAAKTVNEVFSPKYHGLAMGIAIGGSALGSVLSPPFTIFVSNSLDWRWSFIIPGIIGILWFVCWWWIPWKSNNQGIINVDKRKQTPIIEILTNKIALSFLFIRFLLDPVFYFIMFWIPKYLNEYRNISFDKIGQLLWIPFLALGISNILGGWLSDRLVKSGIPIIRARRIVMGAAAVLTLSAILIQSVKSETLAIGLMTLLMFAHGLWITNYITSISDMFLNNGAATVVGLSGTAGALSALIINPLIGSIIENYSYTPLWIACGLMYPIAFILFVFSVRKTKSQLKVKA